MIRYDAVPYLGLADDIFSLRDLSGEHIGPSITLAPADPGQDNTDLERNILYERFYLQKSDPSVGQFSLLGHSMSAYRAKIERLVELGDDPVQDGGFADGSWCGDDAECLNYVQSSGTGGCIYNSCRAGKVNDFCELSRQCISQRCDFAWAGGLRCFEKLGKGEGCNEDSDCAGSLECTWWWRCG